MSGGILWRIVIGGSSFSAIMAGPTTAATIHGVGLWLPGSSPSNIYCDDGLLPGEEDVLCGLVLRYTGEFKRYITIVLFNFFSSNPKSN